MGGADRGEMTPSGQGRHPQLWTPLEGHLQQIRQHQGLLSHQRGQGGPGGPTSPARPAGQSHHRAFAAFFASRARRARVQHFPGWGELQLSESSRFWAFLRPQSGPPHS